MKGVEQPRPGVEGPGIPPIPTHKKIKVGTFSTTALVIDLVTKTPNPHSSARESIKGQGIPFKREEKIKGKSKE